MRLATIGGAAAFVLATVIVGCSDQPGSPSAAITAPRSGMRDGSRFRLQGMGSVNIRTANGVIARALPGWTATGTMRDGVVSDESGSSPLGVIAISSSIMKPKGGDHQATFTDSYGNQITTVMVRGRDGAPMSAMRLYRNGVLQAGADYDWVAVPGGWSLRSVNRIVMKDGQVSAQIRIAANGTLELASNGGVRDALARFGEVTARTLSPRDLSAQEVFSGKCRTQANAYYAAEVALAAAIVAMETTGTPLAVAAFFVASAHAQATEMAYWICLQNEDSHNNPIVPALPPPIVCHWVFAPDPSCDPAERE
jgi:hypothetical protein